MVFKSKSMPQQQYLSTKLKFAADAPLKAYTSTTKYNISREAERGRERLVVWFGPARRATAKRKAAWREKKRVLVQAPVFEVGDCLPVSRPAETCCKFMRLFIPFPLSAWQIKIHRNRTTFHAI